MSGLRESDRTSIHATGWRPPSETISIQHPQFPWVDRVKHRGRNDDVAYDGGVATWANDGHRAAAAWRA
jgi:hypothetical protein